MSNPNQQSPLAVPLFTAREVRAVCGLAGMQVWATTTSGRTVRVIGAREQPERTGNGPPGLVGPDREPDTALWVHGQDVSGGPWAARRWWRARRCWVSER